MAGRVLVVDDNPDCCRLLARLLKSGGHQAAYLTSGEEAIAYVRKNPVDVMILDMMMPGMDGMEVLRHIRSDPGSSRLPVIMYSAVSDPAFRQHAMDKGASDYWVKASFDLAKLHGSISKWLPDGHAAAAPDTPKP